MSLRISCFAPEHPEPPPLPLACLQVTVSRFAGPRLEVESILSTLRGPDFYQQEAYDVAECPPEDLAGAMSDAIDRLGAFAREGGAI